MRIGVLVMVAAVMGGCSGNDEVVPIDGPVIDGPVIDAPEIDAPEIDAPEIDAPAIDAPEIDAPAACSQCTSAQACVAGVCELRLEPALDVVREMLRMEQLLLAYYDANGTFPQVAVAFTPAAHCCTSPGNVCPANPANWSAPAPWAIFGFSIDEPHYGVHSYWSGTGTEAIAVARTDLDCDGTASDMTLTCTALANGDARCDLVLPAVID